MESPAAIQVDILLPRVRVVGQSAGYVPELESLLDRMTQFGQLPQLAECYRQIDSGLGAINFLMYVQCS